MRRREKEQWLELLNTLEEAHSVIIQYLENNNMEAATSLLEDCRSAVTGLINSVKVVLGENELLFYIKQYGDTIDNVQNDCDQRLEINSKNLPKKLNKDILKIRNTINSLEVKHEMVFLPYKASMWDALESIWQAADVDENCDAYVIPIPYYDRNPDGSFGEMHYEGDLFPEYVPITHFDDYNYVDRHPDAIFIHNPYDGINIVTSVHPFFYSDNLRQLTDCLVYSPYYVAPGKLGDGQKYLPSYENMDYILVQSESIRNQYDPRIPKEKLLVFGSPKFDRIIKMCKNPPEPPKEWKEKMEGKRVFFYNTSIGDFLKYDEVYLKKMEYVFDSFKKEKDACIIWRPHPLFEATLDSMRPELKGEYLRIKKRFIDGNIGILDTTEDIDKTIALSDAYLGDGGSSVVSLFGVANKPIYFLNYALEQDKIESVKKRLFRYYIRRNNMDMFCLVAFRYVMLAPNNDYHYKYLIDLDENGEGFLYSSHLTINKNGYFFPLTARDIVEVSESGEIKKYYLDGNIGKGTRFTGPGLYKNKAVIYGINEAIIIVFDIKTKHIRYTRLPEGYYYGEDENGQLEISAVAIGWKDKIIVTNYEGTECIIIDINTFDTDIKPLPIGKRIQGIIREYSDAGLLWLQPYEGNIIYEWNTVDDSFTEHYINFDGLKSYDRTDGNLVNERYFSNGVIHGKYIYFSPMWSNMFVKYDWVSHVATKLELPFSLYDGGEMSEEFLYGGGSFGTIVEEEFDSDDYSVYKKSPERIFFNAYADYKVYDVDINAHTLTPIEVDLDLKTLYEKENRGFHVDNVSNAYYCSENAFCSIKDFIENHVGPHTFNPIVQKSIYLGLNASPEGNAGKNIYDYIISRLKVK